MTTTPSDRRRYGVIETRFRTHGKIALYILTVGGQSWAQVEWSPSRRAWCIQDASGRCLAHCDAIHGQHVDAQTAVALAKRMIVDGRMPTPEEAEAQLHERLAAEDAASPADAGADALRVDTIAAQLEEIEQERLIDCAFEEATLERTHDQPNRPAGRRRHGPGPAMADRTIVRSAI